MNRILDTSKEYLQTYKEPLTDEGQAVLAAYINTYEAYFNLLDENGEFLTGLLADNLTEDDYDSFDKKLEAINAEITHELDELTLLFSEYSKEFNVTFIDSIY